MNDFSFVNDLFFFICRAFADLKEHTKHTKWTTELSTTTTSRRFCLKMI